MGKMTLSHDAFSRGAATEPGNEMHPSGDARGATSLIGSRFPTSEIIGVPIDDFWRGERRQRQDPIL